jgi:phosphoribosyl 1,2-cyclic phosphate phosphodiesterase
VKTVEALAPRRAFFTHICHDLRHARAESLLPPNIRLAYDGLQLTFDLPLITDPLPLA